MEKTYRPYDPDQLLLLPPALQDWLPADHVVFFLSDLVDHLDLTAITAPYEQESRGYPPYHPRMMVKLLLYGYAIGIASSRRLAQRCQEDVAVRVLSASGTWPPWKPSSCRSSAAVSGPGSCSWAPSPWTAPRCGPTPPSTRR
jgi:transposase